MRICQADWNHWPDAPSPAESDPRCWAACARLGVDAIEVGVYDAAVELAPDRETARDVLTGEALRSGRRPARCADPEVL
ncbi:MAG: hypothetical protein GEU83_11690 [Pseudonocardiaceae bacterium]|nr:hypothetical protein [Pseudonocardiaceae bacterium]